jgi:hypothetical protein
MTSDEARDLIIESMNYAAYQEADSSLHDADKNLLFGSAHYKPGRMIKRNNVLIFSSKSPSAPG